MKLPLDIIPAEIFQQYRLKDLSHKGFLYMEIQKCVYGLIQSEKLSNDKLMLHLDEYGYEPAPITSDFWRNQTRHLQFSLAVDDFGVKY